MIKPPKASAQYCRAVERYAEAHYQTLLSEQEYRGWKERDFDFPVLFQQVIKPSHAKLEKAQIAAVSPMDP